MKYFPEIPDWNISSLKAIAFNARISLISVFLLHSILESIAYQQFRNPYSTVADSRKIFLNTTIEENLKYMACIAFNGKR